MKSKEIDINIVNETLTITNENMITGEIYFVTENEVFPEKGWNDFVVVILTWWHDALINLIQSEQNGTEQAFEFMDGPLSVKAIKMSENVLELQFIKERRETEEIFF